MNRVNDALYILATQRGQRLEQAGREAWKYEGLVLDRAPGLRARLAVALVALAAWLVPDATATTGAGIPAHAQHDGSTA